jgi:hypothetical protein
METKELVVRYHGNEFFMKIADGGELINITDIWRGEGAVETKAPDKWLHVSETAEFLITCLKGSPGTFLARRPDPHQGSKMAIRAWADIIIKECEKQGLIKKTKGRSGGTYVHWQIAMSYAQYLSPELHGIVNAVFRERVQETIDPDLGLRRSRKRAVKSWKAMGYDEPWISNRINGIDRRNEFTSTLGAHGVDNGGYGRCTNAIYIPILHGSASDVRKMRNIPPRVNLRDVLDDCELAGIQFAEVLAMRNIKRGDVFGTEPCIQESYKAAHAIHVALEMAETAPVKMITR